MDRKLEESETGRYAPREYTGSVSVRQDSHRRRTSLRLAMWVKGMRTPNEKAFRRRHEAEVRTRVGGTWFADPKLNGLERSIRIENISSAGKADIRSFGLVKT